MPSSNIFPIYTPIRTIQDELDMLDHVLEGALMNLLRGDQFDERILFLFQDRLCLIQEVHKFMLDMGVTKSALKRTRFMRSTSGL